LYIISTIATAGDGRRRESRSTNRTGPWDRGYAAGYRRGILDGESRAREEFRARLAEMEMRFITHNPNLPTPVERAPDAEVLELFAESDQRQLDDVQGTPSFTGNEPERVPIGEPIDGGFGANPPDTRTDAPNVPLPTNHSCDPVVVEPDQNSTVTTQILSHVSLKMTTVRRTIVNLHIAQRHIEAYMTKHCADWEGTRKMAVRDQVCLRWLAGEGDEALMSRAIGDHNGTDVPFAWLIRYVLGSAGAKSAEFWYRNHRLEGRAMVQSAPLRKYKWHVLAINFACFAAFVHAARKGRFKSGLFAGLGMACTSVLSKFLFKYDAQVIPLD